MNSTQAKILAYIAENSPEKTTALSKNLKLGIKEITVRSYVRMFARLGYIEVPRFYITEKGLQALNEFKEGDQPAAGQEVKDEQV